MPLVWAHAEYAKLVRSLHDGRVFDMPQQPYERYVRQRLGCDITLWASHSRTRSMPVANRLRIQTPPDTVVRWSVDDGDAQDVVCRDTTVGVWMADLDTERLPHGSVIRFSIGDEEHEVEVVA